MRAVVLTPWPADPSVMEEDNRSLLGAHVLPDGGAKAGPLDWSDRAVLALTDPLGAVNAQLDRWLGVKTTLQLQPIGSRLRTPGQHPLAFVLRLRKRAPPVGVCKCT